LITSEIDKLTVLLLHRRCRFESDFLTKKYISLISFELTDNPITEGERHTQRKI